MLPWKSNGDFFLYGKDNLYIGQSADIILLVSRDTSKVLTQNPHMMLSVSMIIVDDYMVEFVLFSKFNSIY